MRLRLTYCCVAMLLGAFAASFGLAGPAAHAFTIEGQEADGQFSVPKFDLEEQARRFRRDGTDGSTIDRREFSTPLGNGTIHFGVDQRSTSNFGPGFSPLFGFGPQSGVGPTRRDFDRVVAPPNSPYYYDNR